MKNVKYCNCKVVDLTIDLGDYCARCGKKLPPLDNQTPNISKIKKAIYTELWLCSEWSGIGLGRFAPYVFEGMLGIKGHKINVRPHYLVYIKSIIKRFFIIDSFCKQCGINVCDFLVDDTLWQQVKQSTGKNVLCYNCFVKHCRKSEICTIFHLTPIK